MSYIYEEVELHNPGVIQTKIPLEIFNYNRKNIEIEINRQNSIRNSKYPDKTNIIDKEYSYIIEDNLKSILVEMTQAFSSRFNFVRNANIQVSEICKINMQRKYEFVPSKQSPGALTWLLWIQIPYDIEEELSISKIVENNSGAVSRLEFIYNLLNSGLHSEFLNIDKSGEGTLLLFPSYIKHAIHPFYTSDEYRVFLSGNIWLSRDNKWVNGTVEDLQ